MNKYTECGTTLMAKLCDEIITTVCNYTFLKKQNYGEDKKLVYWWSNRIAEAKKLCGNIKREMIRENRQNTSQMLTKYARQKIMLTN